MSHRLNTALTESGYKESFSSVRLRSANLSKIKKKKLSCED